MESTMQRNTILGGVFGEGSKVPQRALAIDPIGSSVNIALKDRPDKPATLYFTSDLSAEGLQKIYKTVASRLTGKVAVKLHTGEKNGPNIIPAAWVKTLWPSIPQATIVETNTYYDGDRYTTKQHRETLEVNGWTFCPIDIMDEHGVREFPLRGGKWFKTISLGESLANYDSMLVLTHFKGHTLGGFGGSIKNIGIGCADGRIGKRDIHTHPGQNQWSIGEEEFMERMTESAKATVDFFGEHIVYINVLRNMSVSCDCEGIYAEPVETPDVGIIAGTDILAVDQASVDMIYALGDSSAALRARIETRRGLRQLSYAKELGMGSDNYKLISID